MAGYYSVRALGYKNVREPGCYELQIEHEAMEKYLVELAKQEELPDRARLVLSKRGDGLTEVIALRHRTSRDTHRTRQPGRCKSTLKLADHAETEFRSDYSAQNVFNGTLRHPVLVQAQHRPRHHAVNVVAFHPSDEVIAKRYSPAR